MMRQAGLFGEKVLDAVNKLGGAQKTKQGDAPRGCTSQCYYATEKQCVCRCNGKFHGLGAGLTKLNLGNQKVKRE